MEGEQTSQLNGMSQANIFNYFHKCGNTFIIYLKSIDLLLTTRIDCFIIIPWIEIKEL